MARAALALQHGFGGGLAARRIPYSLTLRRGRRRWFVKEAGSLFVFLQGHPEYDATSLFGEYRRDLRRYLAGERDGHPELPQGYFSDRATALLLAFRERAERQRDVGLLQEFPAAEIGAELTAPWRDAATRLYANWLSYVAEQRDAIAPVRPVEPACA